MSRANSTYKKGLNRHCMLIILLSSLCVSIYTTHIHFIFLSRNYCRGLHYRFMFTFWIIFWPWKVNNLSHLSPSFICSLNQPPLSGNGSNMGGRNHLHPTLSPDVDDSDSDSDISLGTHSPIPSMASSLGQHSPNSSSGLNDRDLERLAEQHKDERGEKDYRNFASLNSFRFSENFTMSGFTSKFRIFSCMENDTN